MDAWEQELALFKIDVLRLTFYSFADSPRHRLATPLEHRQPAAIDKSAQGGEAGDGIAVRVQSG